MNTQTSRRHWIAILVIASFAFWPITITADASAPTKKQARYEVDFLTGMIDHHSMAVMMAEMCIDRAVHPELEELCERIKTSQMEEIATMQSWLQNWYDISYQPQMKPGEEKSMEKLAALSGSEFEIEFMQMMIKHHEKAVREGMHCMNRAYHADLIELCENIVQTQTQEIMLMENWLCEWYSVCR